MKKISRIAVINLVILSIYTILIHFSEVKSGSGEGAVLSILLSSVMPIGIQVLVNIVISIFHFTGKNRELGKAYLLSSVLVVIIGFSTCWGSAYIAVAHISR